MSDIITIQNLRFRWPGNSVDTLSIEMLNIKAGEKVFIRGASGAGKTTLLNLLSGVAEANSGLISVLGHEIKRLRPAARDHFRAQHIGYIFQAFNLIPYLTMVQNVALACHFSKERKQRVLKRATSLDAEIHRLLDHLELNDERLLHKPVTTLSIGQQQRVAIARTVLHQPNILMCDEPFSALDSEVLENTKDFIKRFVIKNQIPCLIEVLKKFQRITCRIFTNLPVFNIAFPAKCFL